MCKVPVVDQKLVETSLRALSTPSKQSQDVSEMSQDNQVSTEGKK